MTKPYLFFSERCTIEAAGAGEELEEGERVRTDKTEVLPQCAECRG